MKPHPDFADVTFPRSHVLGDLHLTPLSPDHVDEDFDVVMESAPLLKDTFGTWPAELTRDANLIDLAWHEREFTAGRSFAWILRDANGRYLGCFYIYPAMGERGWADAVLWLRDMPDRTGAAIRFKGALVAWLGEILPADLRLDWLTRPAI